MAAKTKTYYAWSPITIRDSVRDDGSFVTIPAGDKVAKSQVGESDWSNLISSGAIRIEPYPVTRSDESPRNAKLRLANEAMKKAMEPFKEDFDDDDDEAEGVSVNEDTDKSKLPTSTRNN